MKTVAAAIDFGTSKIVTLLAESGGQNRCEILGSGVTAYDGYTDGQFNVPEKLNQAIRLSITAAELESKRRIKEIYVGVPAGNVHVYTAQAEVTSDSADGRIEDVSVDQVLDAAADKLNLQRTGEVVIHRSPAWFQVDNGKKDMTPVGRRGKILRAMVSFVTADEEFVREMRGRFMEMGITVLGFLSSSMGEALWLVPMEERDRSSVLIDMGYLSTELMVVEGDALTYHTVVPLGGGHITMDLAYALNVRMGVAEKVKRSYSFVDDEFDPAGDTEIVEEDGRRVRFPREQVRQAVEARTDEITEMIEAALNGAGPYMGARAQIFLTGGGITMMPGGREYLGEQLRRLVKAPMPRASRLNTPDYASAWGLVDLLFDSILSDQTDQGSIASKVKSGIRGLFSR